MKNMKKYLLFSLAIVFPALLFSRDDHNYLTELYDNLHSSPKQQYFRQFAPMSVGAVYLQRTGEGEKELRWHFRTMKKLGFTSTKQLLTTSDWTFEDAALIALEEGIIPWWYGEAGWEMITPDLLNKIGLPKNMSLKEARIHPKMIEYQTNVLKNRVLLAPDNQPFTSWEDFENRWEKIGSKEYRHIRDIFRELPVRARTGVSRALINANVPFEYVTPSDLKKGLAPRYRTIYLPFVIAIDHEILKILHDYVQQGGRLIMDMPSAWYDENGALLYTDTGTPFEKLFGITINQYQFAGINIPCDIDGKELHGFTLDMSPTTAEIIRQYNNGDPAVTINFAGRGSALILGYEASMECFTPGNEEAEKELVNYILGDYKPYYHCDGAIVYRIASGKADQYFLINDDEAKTVSLNCEYSYKSMEDAVTGERLNPGEPIELERFNGRWIRCEK